MAFGSVANILLEVTGESADAKRELADVARELALFSREEAEAAAYVDGSEAHRELDELKVALERIDAKEVSAEVNVRIAKAQADLTALQAELKKIDGENVEVDVDVKRGISEKLGALSGLVAQIGKDTDSSAGGLRRFASGILEADIGVGRWSASLSSILSVGPLVLAVIAALVGQLAAVVASAVSAAGGIGALAIAFGAALVPGILLAIGAFAQFASQADVAGTAAHALQTAFGQFGDTFKAATAGGADALFRGLADSLQTLQPLVQSLGPAFTRLGEAGGEAMRSLAEHFSSPVWENFFSFATDSLARLTPLMARSFGAFGDILRNIATAAMPFLIAGLRSVAEFLEGIADNTSDIGALRTVIGGMVDSLGAWLKLLGGAADLVGAFVGAFAPLGDGIVESLAEGAHNLADWLRSEDGLERIKAFFKDTGPVAAEFGRLLLNVGKILIQIGQFFAPLAAAALHALNSILEGVSGLIDWLTRLDRSLTLDKVWAALKSGAASAWATVMAILTAPIHFAIGFADGIAGRARAIWDAVKGVISDGIRFVLQFADGIAGRARAIWQAVKGVVTDVIRFILNFPDGVAGRARSIWSAVKGVVNDAINFVLSLPDDLAGRARNIWQAVKGVISDGINFVLSLPGVGGLVSAARAIWDAINSALPDIEINIHIPTPSVPDIPGLAVGVRDLPVAGLHRVGEEGEELAFLPQGSDVFTASETRRILRALAEGVASPLAGVGSGTPVAAASGGGGNTFNVQVVSPGTGSPDPDVAVAKLEAVLRARAGVRVG